MHNTRDSLTAGLVGWAVAVNEGYMVELLVVLLLLLEDFNLLASSSDNLIALAMSSSPLFAAAD